MKNKERLAEIWKQMMEINSKADEKRLEVIEFMKQVITDIAEIIENPEELEAIGDTVLQGLTGWGNLLPYGFRTEIDYLNEFRRGMWALERVGGYIEFREEKEAIKKNFYILFFKYLKSIKKEKEE
jgi:hypothetical protein